MSTSSPDAIQNDNGALSSAPDSPAVLSPQSPPPNGSPDVKIDTDYLSQEPGLNNQQIELSAIDKLDTAPNQPTPVPTPVHPDSIPAAPPSSTPPPPQDQLLQDVDMAEDASLSNSLVLDNTNSHHQEDVQLNGLNGHATLSEDLNSATPRVGSPMDTSIVASSSRPRLDPEGSDDQPPAKRARTVSDADQASLVHSPAQPPPPTEQSEGPSEGPSEAVAIRSATPTPQVARTSTLSLQQFRFCISTIRILRKLKDATPFLQPVDPVALNIPHYPTIVKHPMDFSTVDRKLASSNPSKPDINPNNPRYLSADEFITDIRLIFSNCVLFNGPDHPVTVMGKRLEATFDKQIKNLPPPAEEPKPPAPKKLPTPPPTVVSHAPPTPSAATPPAAQKKARRPSMTLPVIRRNEVAETTRPKREIHPPPPKDLLYADAPKKHRAGKKSKQIDVNVDQLRYCAKVLNDLHKKQHYAIASPFYEPVDFVALKIPSYPKIIKKPMDLSQMRRKLEAGEYLSAPRFRDDFDLMIRNCMTFNPIGNPVHNCGVELKKLFEEKWAGLPPLKQISDDEDEDEEEEDEEEARRRAIAMLESQIDEMKGNLAALKASVKKPKKEKKEKREKKRDKQMSPPVASSSKANGKPAKQSGGGGGGSKKKSSKKALVDDDVLSFDQKKDLSEAIQRLDGAKLEKVITIIHEGVPEIGESSEEIELDIDSLPPSVLTKLYNLVLKPLRTTVTKRPRTGTGTGGLKRKSMDEDVEAEKIRKLEERMRLFDKPGGGSDWNTKAAVDSDHSSDDSSSESSASDSE